MAWLLGARGEHTKSYDSNASRLHCSPSPQTKQNKVILDIGFTRSVNHGSTSKPESHMSALPDLHLDRDRQIASPR